MKKLNTSPLSGTQELLPWAQTLFDKYRETIAAAYAAHGFQHIDTPAIDRTEILLAKAGGETEKQIYRVYKTSKKAADSEQALRFDQTVSLARYTVEHENDLAFPFRVYQIGRSYRGERAQKGRFREFYQCDVDVIGRNRLAVAYDAEVIATLYDALRSIKGLPEFRIRISNRKILTGLLQELNLDDLSAEIFAIVDHAEKVPREQTVAALQGLGLGSENVVKITAFTEIRGGRHEVMTKLHSFKLENATFRTGVTELNEVLELLEAQLPAENFIADMLIVRGLDYYTGTVFETFCLEYPGLGSICSGGRYENLAGHYTDWILPGVGGSIGLTRLFSVLTEAGLISSDATAPIDIALIPLDKTVRGRTFLLAKQLRAEGKTVDVVLSDKKLWDKMAHAAKVAKYACVLGPDEIIRGSAQLKDLKTGELSELKFG